MSRTVYVNGEFLPEAEAKISVFDRAVLFADAVYEVTTVLGGKLIDNARHLERLQRSMDALQMRAPVPPEQITAIQYELAERNDLTEGLIYLQVSRGIADRDFVPPSEAQPAMFMFTQARSLRESAAAERGMKIALLQDQRWGRRDIKTTMLLPASLAKMAAKEQGCDDAWMVEDGHITEGTSNNAFIVTVEGTIVTRGLGPHLLPGITRRAVLEIAAEMGLKVEERAFTPDEAKAATEAFVTSASSFVMPVTQIDGQTLSQGVPGPTSMRLRARYIELALDSAQEA